MASETSWDNGDASMNDADHETRQGQKDRKEEEDDLGKEDELEEWVDNEPMHITGRLFLGSIDAARNAVALKRLHITETIALLGKGEEEKAAPWSRDSSTATSERAEQQLTRTLVEMVDSKDGDLLRKIPKILEILKKTMYDESLSGEEVKVSIVCSVAGRSRSASVVAAWMLVSEPKLLSVQDVVDRIRIIRPWIEINAHFMRDLHVFHAVLGSTGGATLSAGKAALLADRSFPRLDFGANLVDGILQGTKTITMRLVSDIEDDHESDLGDIFPYSVVLATTTTSNSVSRREPFAYLRIDQIEIQELSAIDQGILHNSGFNSTEAILATLKQFYPNVTIHTCLRMLHFRYLCPVAGTVAIK